MALFIGPESYVEEKQGVAISKFHSRTFWHPPSRCYNSESWGSHARLAKIAMYWPGYTQERDIWFMNCYFLAF